MSHLIKNQTIEIITNQGIEYPKDLFLNRSGDLEKFLEKSKNYFIIGKYEVDMRDDSNGQKITVYKGIILKTSPAYEYQHKVYGNIWFSLNHKDYVTMPNWILDYEGEPTLLMPVTCCACNPDSMLDIAALDYEPWPRNNPGVKPVKSEPETEEIEVEVTDSTSESIIAKKNGKLSDAGWKYYNERMDELCKNDPGGGENMRIAIWFVRMERKQRRRSFKVAIYNSAKKYNIDRTLLLSRIQSGNSLYRWGKKK